MSVGFTNTNLGHFKEICEIFKYEEVYNIGFYISQFLGMNDRPSEPLSFEWSSQVWLGHQVKIDNSESLLVHLFSRKKSERATSFF